MINRNRHYVRSLAKVILSCAEQGPALRTTWMIPAKPPKVMVNLVSKHGDVGRNLLADGPRNATSLDHSK